CRFHRPGTPDLHTLSLHDALPIFVAETRQGAGCEVLDEHVGTLDQPPEQGVVRRIPQVEAQRFLAAIEPDEVGAAALDVVVVAADRKSTRLNSSHVKISYAVFCLK